MRAVRTLMRIVGRTLVGLAGLAGAAAVAGRIAFERQMAGRSTPCWPLGGRRPRGPYAKGSPGCPARRLEETNVWRSHLPGSAVLGVVASAPPRPRVRPRPSFGHGDHLSAP
jgi:hypothetical protein